MIFNFVGLVNRKVKTAMAEYETRETSPTLNFMKRFTVSWDGYAESPAKVVDSKTQSVLKEFTPYEIGTANACKAAARLATELNGEEKRCPECSGEGREQCGPSEQPCGHCNGKGYQVFVDRN